MNVFVSNNYSDFWPESATTINVNGLEEIVDGAGSTITRISNGANNQIVRINCAGLAALSAINVNDPRNSGTGNIYLKDGEIFNMATGHVVTLKFDKPNDRWYEISRGYAGNFLGSGKPAGSDRIVFDGWDVTDLQDSVTTAQVVKRFSSAEELGQYVRLVRDCSIRNINIFSNTTISTGTITASLYFNGGSVGTVVLSSGTSNITTYGKYSKIATAGTVIEMRYATSNDFGHTGADIKMWIEAEY